MASTTSTTSEKEGIIIDDDEYPVEINGTAVVVVVVIVVVVLVIDFVEIVFVVVGYSVDATGPNHFASECEGSFCWHRDRRDIIMNINNNIDRLTMVRAKTIQSFEQKILLWYNTNVNHTHARNEIKPNQTL